MWITLTGAQAAPTEAALPDACAPHAGLSAASRPASSTASSPGIALGSGLTDGLRTHRGGAGEYLTLIGARHGVSAAVIARDNGIAANGPLKAGQSLSIDARHIVPALREDGLLINVAQRMLFHLSDGRLSDAYPIAAGRADWPTPRGPFQIVDLQRDKAWIVPPSIQREMAREGQEVLTRVEPGPENPLGRHWIGLSIPGIGIHGTNAPASLYALRSHGCIRMHPDDVAELFGRVSRGTPGEIVYHPVLLGRLPDGRVFVEAHPDTYRLMADPRSALTAIADSLGLRDVIDWQRVSQVLRAREGIARDVTVRPAARGQDEGPEKGSTRP
jgi:L,D-transpeptidase ErfK/SrfK